MKKKGNILTIAKKEFARFFKDKGLVFSDYETEELLEEFFS